MWPAWVQTGVGGLDSSAFFTFLIKSPSGYFLYKLYTPAYWVILSNAARHFDSICIHVLHLSIALYQCVCAFVCHIRMHHYALMCLHILHVTISSWHIYEAPLHNDRASI